MKGFFKCDDDVIVNIKSINIILNIMSKTEIDYCGKSLIRTKEYNKWANSVGIDKYKTYACNYAGGPLYFLSKKAFDYFHPSNDINIIYYEDMMVGYHLNRYNIFVNPNFNLYTGDIKESAKLSFHNSTHINEVIVTLRGGLGNQLFQIACGMHFAKKHNKKFILNKNRLIPNSHQNYDLNRTIITIKKIFPELEIKEYELCDTKYILYDESKNNCFKYEENQIEYYFYTYNNVILHGYFIHNDYIPEDIFSNAIIRPYNNNLLKMDFTNLYFIHIRLGDFLNTKMYQIELKEYYKICANKILVSNPNAKFIICTNQYDSSLSDYLECFPKEMSYTIQDSSDIDIDTLYIMASCCGGICANSTLSFMGSVFQKKKDNIYMPYPFVDFIYGFNETNIKTDMYPKWANIYDTKQNKFIV